jgi:hypothetical protein
MVSVSPSAPGYMNVVAPVTTVREEVEDRAQEKDRPRKDAQNMRPVLLPEEKGCDCQKPAQRE